MMKVFVLILYYLIIQRTVIDASNQYYLGCFIDQIGNRDLSTFIGDYDQLTPKQCILLCREQNFLYAAIQYGNECRCGQQYGKYGQVSDDECDYLCSTSEKCGGDYRNSVYSVVNSIDISNTGFTCQNNLAGYQGCFASATLTTGVDMVNSIEECIDRCTEKYNYAGITNGNLCYCGNDLNLSSITSNLCNIRCQKNSNDLTIDCCGGLDVLSVYNIKNYQSSSSSLKDLSEKLLRVKRVVAAIDSTDTSTYTIEYSSMATSLNTISLAAITSQSLITTSTPSSISSSLNSNTNTNQPVSSITSTLNDIPTSVHPSFMMSNVTSTTPTSSENTAGILITTSYLSTSTMPTSIGTSTLVTTIPTSTSSISVSQFSNNPMTTTITTMSSIGSNSMYPVTSNTGTLSSLHTYTNESITNTAIEVSSTPSVTFTSQSSLHTETSNEANSGTASLLYTSSSQTSSYTDTTISLNSTITSNILSVTSPSLHMDTTESVSPSYTTESSLISGSQPISSTPTETSLTSTMNSIPTTYQSVSTASTYLSQMPTVSISANPFSSNSIASSNPSAFTTIMTTEAPSTSFITSTYSNQITATVVEQSSSGSSIPNTLSLSINSLASNSTNVDIQTTITSSFYTDIANQTTVTNTTISSTIVTTQTVNSTVFTSQAATATFQIVNSTVSTSPTTTVAPSYVISTIFIVSTNQTFIPTDNSTRELIRERLTDIINLAFNCLANSTYPNCTQSRRSKRQLCSLGYNVNLVSDITQVSITPSLTLMVDYTVADPCSGALISPAQVETATDTLSRSQITNILGYAYDGDFIRSASIGGTNTPTADPKLWIIGAVLGPVAFVLLLICVFCYLHYKCRPRPTNRTLAKAISNAPPSSARATNYQTVSNEPIKENPTTEKSVHALAQNDPLVSARRPFRRLSPIASENISHDIPEYIISNEISMDEIRRQNDVERWRNKLRLQEKFQQSAGGFQDLSIPNTNRSDPYQYDNQAFEHDPSNINIQPANEIISIQTPRPMPQTTDIEVGRTKLHRLLDEVLDKADSEDAYNPDSDIERQNRRRQRRRIHSISNDYKTVPLNQQVPHIPVIPQVSERPDPSLVQLRYNHYEAGDRAHDISRLTPIELKPKYTTDDQRYNQYSSRSNPPLFYDDSSIADRASTATDAFATPKRSAKTRVETDREATMRHDGGRVEQRQHKFNDDAVSIDPIINNRDEYRVQARTAWVEPELDKNSLNRKDYRNEYVMAKRSVVNTRNIISSINDELRHIAFPISEDYHA